MNVKYSFWFGFSFFFQVILSSLVVFTVLRGSALFSKEPLLTGGLLTEGRYLLGAATFGHFLNISNLSLLSGFYGILRGIHEVYAVQLINNFMFIKALVGTLQIEITH